MRNRKFLILGLNRDYPGFGDDAVLADCQAGLWRPLPGKFRQGAHVSKSEIYRAACDEYRENGWTDGDDEDEWDPVDDPYRELDNEDIDGEGHISTVMVPKDAEFLIPGTELEVSYCCDDSSSESATVWKSDSYRFDIIEVPYGLSFHVNRAMDGVMLDEDFFDFPLVCWNTGSLSIKVDGKKIPASAYLILLPDDPERKRRRLHYDNIMSIPIWDSEAKIARNEQILLALGCPPEDVHPLAGYFWRSPVNRVADYDPANHAFWMNAVRGEGKSHSQS